MALDNNQFDGHGDIAQFLEKFKEQSFPGVNVSESHYTPRESSVPAKPAQYERSFEKLEKKILELEERFEASAAQNQMILSELARTREAMERQKDKDAFLEHLSRTIANLKASVENLSRAQQDRMAYREPAIQRSFDPVPPAFKDGDTDHTAIYHYQADGRTAGQTHTEREEKERIISSLRQKASQLKAVNSALDREIKKAQQEKMQPIIAKIVDAVNSIAKAEGFVYIMDLQTAQSTGGTFINESLCENVTAKVKSKLGLSATSTPSAATSTNK